MEAEQFEARIDAAHIDQCAWIESSAIERSPVLSGGNFVAGASFEIFPDVLRQPVFRRSGEVIQR
jgi:hypothetical protein